MTYTTGSEERDRWLKRALGEVLACHEQPTLEAVAAALPSDFQLDEEELSGMLGNMQPQTAEPFPAAPPGKPVIETTPAGDPLPTEAVAPQGTYLIEASSPAEAETILPKVREAEARRQLDEANAKLGAARESLVNAQVDRRHRREALAGAIHQWQLLAENTTDGMSAEARRQVEVRNHLAATAAERAARGKPHPKAARFARRTMRNGPSRGAYSMSDAARAGFINRDPSRGPVKLPSEQ